MKLIDLQSDFLDLGSFIKVKNILSLKFKNNLMFHFIKELKKNRFLNSFIK